MANAAIILTATDKTQAAFNNALRNLDALTGAASRFNAALASVGLGVSLQAIGQMADDYASLQARLKLASRSAEEFAAANAAVQRIASASSAPLLETATLYTRIASSLKDTSVSQAEMVDTTEAVALSLRISGASAGEASSAMLQFSQAVASGVLRGEEFNAVNESAPRLMQALAKSLGVSVGALRDMAKEGQLTRDVLINGLARQLPELRREAESLPKTLGATFTDLNNKLLLTVGQIDKITGASNGLAQAFDKIGKPLIITTFQTLGVVGANVAYVFNQVGKEIGGIAAQLAALASGNFREAGIIGDIMKRDAALARKELDDIERRILGLGGKTQDAAAAAAGKAASGRIQLPGAKANKSGKTTKAQSRMSDAEWAMEESAHLTRTLYQIGEEMDQARAAAFDRAEEAAKDWTDSLDAANAKLRDAAAGYIDLIDPVEKYRRKLDEIAQLQEAGLLTKEQATEATFAIQEQIDGLDMLGKKLTETADDFQKTLQKNFQNGLADFLFDPFKDGVDGMLDSFRVMLQRMVAESIAADITRSIFGNFGSGGQNIFGSIAELFGFEQGGIMTGAGPLALQRYAAGGVANSPQLALFGEGRQPEAYVPLPDGRRIPVAMQGGGSGQGGITIHVTIQATDLGSFQRSEGQISATLARAVASARRYQ